MATLLDVWVCELGVYCSQMAAIRSAEKGNKKYRVNDVQAAENTKAAERGHYVRADRAPAPCGYEVVWTAAARKRLKEARARYINPEDGDK